MDKTAFWKYPSQVVSLLGSATSSLASGLFTSLGQLVLLVGGKIILFLLLRHLHPALSGIFGDVGDPAASLPSDRGWYEYIV